MINLTSREKLLTMALMTFIVVWALFIFAIKPAMARVTTLNRIIPEKHDEIIRLRAKSKEYIFLRDSLDNLRTRIAAQEKNFELLAFLETLIRECGLAKKAVSMKQQVSPLDSIYRETTVEIRLENLTIDQLIDFLCKVKGVPPREGSSKHLAKIKSLYIKKNLINKDLLDVVVEIHNAKLIPK